jgi:hypothetical protein
MRRRTVPIVLALAALAAAPAADAPARPQRPITLDGSCDLTGTVTFRPSLTNELRPVAQHARIAGECSGTLTDRRGRRHELKHARARYASDFPAQQASCLLGTPKGAGVMVLRWGRLGFTAQERRATALGTLVLSGTRGGSALVAASPPPSGNPVTLVQACGGSGIKRVTLTAHLQTAPAMSG